MNTSIRIFAGVFLHALVDRLRGELPAAAVTGDNPASVEAKDRSPRRETIARP